jgi:hypothetical protein
LFALGALCKLDSTNNSARDVIFGMTVYKDIGIPQQPFSKASDQGRPIQDSPGGSPDSSGGFIKLGYLLTGKPDSN